MSDRTVYQCFKCGGNMTLETDTFDVIPSYMPVTFSYEGQYMKCEECGADPVPANLARKNDLAHDKARFKAMVELAKQSEELKERLRLIPLEFTEDEPSRIALAEVIEKAIDD